jgi:hypothetical protein
MLIDASPIGEWLKHRPVLRTLAIAILGAVGGATAPWIISDIRPPAPCLMPEQQKKLDAGAKAAEVVTEIFGE